MFITLHEWYYHSGCGYLTKPVAINTDEVSDINEVVDPYHNQDGTAINLKNGRHYNVKESFNEVLKKMQEEQDGQTD